MEKHLHIISLDTPYPVDYGGVYDLFYKLPALQEQGVKIHLHCFTKDRDEQPELNKYCEEVFYYPRNTSNKALSSKLPYIVESRNSDTLKTRLLQDDYPVLMEGVHCTAIANDERFKNRKLFVRLHNTENEYYKQLYQFSTKVKTSVYYWLESKRLYKYEKSLWQHVSGLWAVALKDMEYYQQEFYGTNIQYLPLFIPGWKMNVQEGMGNYCLYHGNLEIEENEFAALWLVKNVFKKINLPFVIAGKNPSKKIFQAIKKNKNISIVANPGEKQMEGIISKAHIHVLPSFNNTGIKIKLLNALFNGKHCVVNDAMVAGTELIELCHVVNDAGEFAERIQLLYHQPLTIGEKNLRMKILQTEFSNQANAQKIVHWIWND